MADKYKFNMKNYMQLTMELLYITHPCQINNGLTQNDVFYEMKYWRLYKTSIFVSGQEINK